MRLKSFLCYMLGIFITYTALEVTIQLRRADIPFTGWYQDVSNPELYVAILSTVAILLFSIVVVIRLTRYKYNSDRLRTVISFVVINLLLSIVIGYNGVCGYLAVALSTATAATVAHPFRYSRVGSMETVLRVMLTSGLTVHMLLGIDSGRTWAIASFFVVDDAMIFIITLYILTLLPLMVIPLNNMIYSIRGQYPCCVVKLTIPALLISIFPTDRYTLLVPILTLVYLGCLAVIFGSYVRSLCEMDSDKVGVITPMTIREETGLSLEALSLVLPHDVYRHILKSA